EPDVPKHGNSPELNSLIRKCRARSGCAANPGNPAFSRAGCVRMWDYPQAECAILARVNKRAIGWILAALFTVWTVQAVPVSATERRGGESPAVCALHASIERRMAVPQSAPRIRARAALAFAIERNAHSSLFHQPLGQRPPPFIIA